MARFSLWKRQDGSAVTEFALVVPVFFLVVFAVIAFGRAYQRLNVLTGGLREGARFASTRALPCSGAELAGIRTRVTSYAGSFGVTLDPLQVLVVCSPGSIGPTSVPTRSVGVGVNNYALFSDLAVWGLNTQTVSRAAVFRCEVESATACP